MADATQTTLRRMREAAGLTIRELETLTGINRGRLSIIERGVVATPEETRLILEALTKGKESAYDALLYWLTRPAWRSPVRAIVHQYQWTAASASPP